MRILSESRVRPVSGVFIGKIRGRMWSNTSKVEHLHAAYIVVYTVGTNPNSVECQGDSE
jgi:hypothetical protein